MIWKNLFSSRYAAFLKLPRLSRHQYAITSNHSYSSQSSRPSWKVKHSHNRFGPEIPDYQYYAYHPNYTSFSLWLRAIKPYIEKIVKDTYHTIHQICVPVYKASVRFFLRHNPTLSCQLICLLSFYWTVQSINMWLNRAYQSLMDMKHDWSIEEAKHLDNIGFWKTQQEDLDDRLKHYHQEHQRLNDLWEKALHAALDRNTSDEGFRVLCDHLMDKPATSPSLFPLVSWRFDMIPYNNEDANIESKNTVDQPLRAFALNSTTNNIFYDWGDYLERRDNKLPMLRPKRHLFTDIYIPPCKS